MILLNVAKLRTLRFFKKLFVRKVTNPEQSYNKLKKLSETDKTSQNNAHVWLMLEKNENIERDLNRNSRETSFSFNFLGEYKKIGKKIRYVLKSSSWSVFIRYRMKRKSGKFFGIRSFSGAKNK